MRRLIVAAMVVACAAGCLGANATSCPSGALCPAGEVCTIGGGCALPGAVAACAGLADGAACESALGGAGTCQGGACETGLCGNGVLDAGEVCDDGNTVSGDGCRGDCLKVEVCGDGILDEGERCDDGNTNPADGCDMCVPTTWIPTSLIGGNRAATAFEVAKPLGLARDRLGNLYVADTDHHAVLRIDASGVITTIAGGGTDGPAHGDGGQATDAVLLLPSGIAVDGLGSVFIVDTHHYRVRRVDPTGVITTVAGTGVNGFAGDGAVGTSAELNFGDLPAGVAVDGLGNVFIADTLDNRVRRVGLDGIITTVIGTGTPAHDGDGGNAVIATLNAPTGLAFDGAGNLYIADTGNNCIRRVDPTNFISTVAGTGTVTGAFSGDGSAATAAELNAPDGVFVDAQDQLYIADTGNDRIRRVDGNGVISTIAGLNASAYSGDGSAAVLATLNAPAAVVADAVAGTVDIADAGNNRVRHIDMHGTISTIAGTGAVNRSGDGGAATAVGLNNPTGVALDAAGNRYFADTSNNRVRRVDPAGVITTVAGTGTLDLGSDGGLATATGIDNPLGVAVDAGSVYFSEANRIRRVDAAGVITTFASGLSNPHGIAFDTQHNLFVADTGTHAVRRIDATGDITIVAGNGAPGGGGDGGAATSAQLDEPGDVKVDSAGNLFIADSVNRRIRRVDATTHVITTVAGTGTPGYNGDGGAATAANLDFPSGIAVTDAGELVIADASAQRVRRVDALGTITTIAGTGTGGTSGDGGPAASAQLTAPTSVAVDPQGKVYVTGGSDGRLRAFTPGGTIFTIAGLIDPAGIGPLALAQLADPTALVIAPAFTLFAGGTSGTVEATLASSSVLEAVAGRYQQGDATGALARFRDEDFGTVSGVAYDAAANIIYLTESSRDRLDAVTIVDPADVTTWTFEQLNTDNFGPGSADGAIGSAQFRGPTGLFFDAPAHVLYVADTGNHVVRAVDLTSGPTTATVTTVAGVPGTLGYFGDGGPATAALLFEPRAITRCASGDLYIADTANQRVRRIAAGTGIITTVLGNGVAASVGDGAPAASFPIDAPAGLACDALGNLFVTSTTTVRLVPADAAGVVDGLTGVETIYGAAPRDVFPASVTTCLSGLAIVNATTIEIVDACTGLLVQLVRKPAP